MHSHFQSLTNKRLELKGDPQFTLEVATLGESNRGEPGLLQSNSRRPEVDTNHLVSPGTKTTLDTVMKIFKSAFGEQAVTV